MHNVGVELQKKAGGEQKGEIISEITEQISDLIPYSKGTGSIINLHFYLISLSFATVSMAFFGEFMKKIKKDEKTIAFLKSLW